MIRTLLESNISGGSSELTFIDGSRWLGYAGCGPGSTVCHAPCSGGRVGEGGVVVRVCGVAGRGWRLHGERGHAVRHSFRYHIL